MAQETVTIGLAAPIRNGDSFTVDYPDGRWASDFANDGHYIFPRALQATFGQEEAHGIDIAFGASNVVITYRGRTTIPDATFVSCNLNLQALDEEIEPDNLIDFTTNTALVDGEATTAIAALSTTRATTALASTAAGAWSSIPVNTPRITDLGLLVEPQGTNYIRNANGNGASAVSYPTNWVATGSLNGLTVDVSPAGGTANGLAYTKMRWFGTPTISFGISIIFETTTGVSAAQFDLWTGRLWLSLQAGSNIDGCAFSIGFQELDAAGTLIGTARTRPILPPVGGVFGQESYAYSTTMLNATCAHTRTFAQIIVTAGVPIDFALFLHPELTKSGAPMSAPIPTNTVTVTRNADAVTFPTLAPPAGGYAVTVQAPDGDGAYGTLASWNDGTTSNQIKLTRDEARFGHLVVTSGGVEQCDLLLEEIDDGAVVEVECAWTAAGRFTARVGDELVVPSASGLAVPAGLTTMTLGADAAGANGWGGYLRRLATYGPAFRVLGTEQQENAWQQAGTLAWTPDEVEEATPGHECKETWLNLRVDMDCTQLRFGFAGYWADINDQEVDLGNGQEIEAALNLLGSGSTNQIVRLTFSNQVAGIIPDGEAIYWSDAISASAFGLVKFSKNLMVRLQQRRTVQTGQYHAINFNNSLLEDEAIFHDGSLDSQVMSTAASMTTAGSGASLPDQFPVAFICLPSVPGNISVALSTDSIGEGYGDVTFGGAGVTRGGMGGPFQRAAYALGYAVGKTDARGGTRAVQSRRNDDKRRYLNQYYTHKILQRFTNDAAVVLSEAVLRANRYIAQRSRKSSYGKMRHVAVAKGICRSTSSNGFIDAAGQTVATNYQDGGIFRAAYATMLTNDTTGIFDEVLDPNASLSDATEHGKWGNNAGTAWTGDGTHPNSFGHIVFGTAVQTPMAAWT